jgi:type II secretion system protein G
VQKRSGFTLIELLIVVAIIAILAAIAVPNFLEAQTRAKVSRAKADMRSLTTALESYAVDSNGKYPFDQDPTGWPYVVTDVISTPIAYMTNGSGLEDLFRTGAGSSASSSKGRRYRFINYPSNLTPVWPAAYIPKTGARSSTPGSDASANLGIAAYGLWKLSSAGPDKTANSGFFAGDLPYDPTNGTVSGGDIIKSQKASLDR